LELAIDIESKENERGFLPMPRVQSVAGLAELDRIAALTIIAPYHSAIPEI
jgi:hypothetical protein